MRPVLGAQAEFKEYLHHPSSRVRRAEALSQMMLDISRKLFFAELAGTAASRAKRKNQSSSGQPRNGHRGLADPDSMSGKAKQAREYGVRLIAETAFWEMIGVEVC